MIFEVYFEDEEAQTITKPIVMSRTIAKQDIMGQGSTGHEPPAQHPTTQPHRWAKDISRLEESRDPVRFALSHFGIALRDNYSLETRLKSIAYAEQVATTNAAAKDLGLPDNTLRHWRKGKEQMIAAVNLLQERGIKEVSHIHLGTDSHGRFIVNIDEDLTRTEVGSSLNHSGQGSEEADSTFIQPSGESPPKMSEQKPEIGIMELVEAEDPVRFALKHYGIPLPGLARHSLETRLKAIAYTEHIGNSYIASQHLGLPRSSLRTWLKEKDQLIAAVQLLKEREIEEVSHIQLKTDSKGRLLVNILGDSNISALEKPQIPSRHSSRLESKGNRRSFAARKFNPIRSGLKGRSKVPKRNLIFPTARKVNSIQSPVKDQSKAPEAKEVADISKLAEAKDPVKLAFSHFGISMKHCKHSFETRLKGIALAEKIGNNTAAARELGLTESTIRGWLKCKKQMIGAIELLKENGIEAVNHINIGTDSEGRFLVDIAENYHPIGLEPDLNTSATGPSKRKRYSLKMKFNAKEHNDYNEAEKHLGVPKSSVRGEHDIEDRVTEGQDLHPDSMVDGDNLDIGSEVQFSVRFPPPLGTQAVIHENQNDTQIEPIEAPKRVIMVQTDSGLVPVEDLMGQTEPKKIIMVQTDSGLEPLHVFAKRVHGMTLKEEDGQDIS